MPILRSRTVLGIARNLRASLNIEGRLTCGMVMDQEPAETLAQKLGRAEARIDQQKRVLEDKDRQISQLKRDSAVGDPGVKIDGLLPQNLIWMFGHGRTGSTWLSAMMGNVRGYSVWFEPSVGALFGNLYYTRSRAAQRASANFILGDRQRRTWLRSIRSFVLEGAAGRFPEIGHSGYLIVKEPHGSIGAPLLSEALPESRMILLIRDPRDTIASSLDAFKKGSWAYEQTRMDDIKEVTLATGSPDEFVEMKAEGYLQQMEKAREAYDAHEGDKALVRYEDLRVDTLGSMRHIYDSLRISVDEAELVRVVDKHSWEKIPDEKRGEGKFYRKGTPGGWREDLTPRQVEIVEHRTAPLLERFYAR